MGVGGILIEFHDPHIQISWPICTSLPTYNTAVDISPPAASLFPHLLVGRYTWFDRDLGMAGRVLVRTPDNPSVITHRLVKIDRPILRIPMLAIHLQRDIHTAGFKPNLQVRVVGWAPL